MARVSSCRKLQSPALEEIEYRRHDIDVAYNISYNQAGDLLPGKAEDKRDIDQCVGERLRVSPATLLQEFVAMVSRNDNQVFIKDAALLQGSEE